MIDPTNPSGIDMAMAKAEQVRYEKMLDEMVSKFLNMKLPKNFSPDGGVIFEKSYRGPFGREDREYNSHYWPTGTNLMDAGQAREMFKHCVPPSCFGLDDCTTNMMLNCDHAKNCGK
jgi:hypothetical protein